ncbi:S1 family serine peptidase [Streptomyces polyrhachis]|uniref:S1 family serine peptidase n=1 Tax=Streptomyces polyrhachis TaxID=1282885 RepID=A0ABW2GK49_9ACTN
MTTVIVAAGGLATGAAPAAAIAGGGDATPQTAPYQVRLDVGGEFVCGGFLRDATTVVTAAHCVDRTPAEAVTVHFDGLDRTRLAQSRTVTRVLAHPGFSWRSGANDAALLKLSSPVTPSSTVGYAVLAGSAPAAGADLTVTGWGRTSAGDLSTPLALKSLNERVAPRGACQSSGLLSFLGLGASGGSSSTLCATPLPGAGFCAGDSGGPASVNGAVVGIVSRNKGCEKPGYDMYTSVSYLHGWLSQPL